MKYKTIMGSALLGLTIILLTVSGSVIQAEIASSNTTMSTAAGPFFVEEMKIVAGIDAAALIELILIGGDVPDIATDARFSSVNNWLFVASDQDNYLPYLVRRPFKAPENATLILEIDSSLGAVGSLAHALDIAGMFAIEYGVTLSWSRLDVLPSGDYLYYFTGGMSNSIFSTLITEFQTDITSGFVSLLNGATVGAAPVKAVVMGEGMLEGRMNPVRGVYYVDDDAITGTTDFTLSTTNVFGALVAPYSGPIALKYSILKFRFPYTINPISISPTTDNFAPHITGKMDWNLNLPWMWVPKPTQNYEVQFNIDHAKLSSYPKVTVNMGYDQNELNTNGRLEMEYFVENTGEENATDIHISYNLGPDFYEILDDIPDLDVLRSDVYIDESALIEIYGTLDVEVLGSPTYTYNQKVLVLEGWYRWVANDSLVNFNPALTDEIVGYNSRDIIPVGLTEVTVSLQCAQGLPTILFDRVIEFLSLVDLTQYDPTELMDIIPDYSAQLGLGVQAAGTDLFNLLYTPQSIFDPDLMDFSFSFRDVGGIGLDARNETILELTIPLLQPDENTTKRWALDNIPARDDHFGIMSVEPVDVGGAYYALQLTTVDKTGYDLMRLLFGHFDPGADFTYSRPLSFYEPWEDIWISAGARFSYMDQEGFEYYGFSNGLNLQVADDEAVLNVHVELDAPAYQVGDPVQVTYTVENTGDVAAEDVEILLYHGRMGSDWQIRDPQLFWTDGVASIAGGGGIYSSVANVEANSFLGIHPVYAVVKFKSDVGQAPAVVDFGPGISAVFEGASETEQIVISNMDWAMLLPTSTDRRPAFPQPILQVEVDVNFIIPEDAPWELELTITITNIGEVVTRLTVIQFYNATNMDLQSRSTTKGNDFNTTIHGMGIILFTGITLEPGQNVIISMRWLFLFSHGCYIPGIIIVYTSPYENELQEGDDDFQPETDTEAPLMQALDGQSQDNEDWEEYGQSTQTGTSAGADVFAGEHTRRMGGIDALYWSLGAILVTAVATTMKKKFKK